MGFTLKVLPEQILESSTVTSVHKVSKQLAELGTVTTSSPLQPMCGSASVIIDPAAVETTRVRKKQQQTQAKRNLLKVCSRLFNFFLSEVLSSEIIEAVH